MNIAVASSLSLHMYRGRLLLFTLFSGRHGAGACVEDPELESKSKKEWVLNKICNSALQVQSYF